MIDMSINIESVTLHWSSIQLHALTSFHESWPLTPVLTPQGAWYRGRLQRAPHHTALYCTALGHAIRRRCGPWRRRIHPPSPEGIRLTERLGAHIGVAEPIAGKRHGTTVCSRPAPAASTCSALYGKQKEFLPTHHLLHQLVPPLHPVASPYLPPQLLNKIPKGRSLDADHCCYGP